jgi:hypothetical protein
VNKRIRAICIQNKNVVHPPVRTQNILDNNVQQYRYTTSGKNMEGDICFSNRDSDMSTRSVADIFDEDIEWTVIFNDKILKTLISKNTSFLDFEKWARSRFGIPSSQRMLFKNILGVEVIPSFHQASKREEGYTIRIEEDQTSIDRYKTMRTKFERLNLFQFSHFYPIISLAYISAFFVPGITIPSPMTYYPYFVPFFDHIGIESEDQRGLYREMILTFITWPVVYVFIRRGMNPEYGWIVSLQKFGIDSFCGAIAATVLVGLKYLLKVKLSI